MNINGVTYKVEIEDELFEFDYDKSTQQLFIFKNAHLITIPLDALEQIIARIRAQVKE